MNEFNTSTNKNRLLFILKHLYKYTNDDYKISTTELTKLLMDNGIKVSRNTLASDMKALKESGFDIITTNGPSNENYYSWGSRIFDLAELRLLIDAVSAAQFIRRNRVRN